MVQTIGFNIWRVSEGSLETHLEVNISFEILYSENDCNSGHYSKL
jgi:hypothetical protein